MHGAYDAVRSRGFSFLPLIEGLHSEGVMKLFRLKVAEMSVRHGEYGERLGHGKVVDLDRVVSHRELEGQKVPVTLGDLVRGREECFEPAEAPVDEVAPRPASPLDVEDEG